MLTELGLGPTCAYRLIGADGSASYAADIDAACLGLDRKTLVIDGARECVTVVTGASDVDGRRGTRPQRDDGQALL